MYEYRAHRGDVIDSDSLGVTVDPSFDVPHKMPPRCTGSKH